MPKNILLLMTDQQRVDYTGYHPQSRLATPHIDWIAEGTQFLRCVTVNPICTPARCALLTGKYTHQIGMLDMSGDLHPQHPTYAQALQRAGYWTAAAGKMHWLQGWNWPTPRGQGHDLVALKDQLRQYGFDYLWEAAGKQLDVKNFSDYGQHLAEKGLLEAYRDHVQSIPRQIDMRDPRTLEVRPFPLPADDYVDRVTADRLIECLRARPSDRPFFLFGSFCGPHPPYDPPQPYLDQVAYAEHDDFIAGTAPLSPEVKQRLYEWRRAYKAMITLIDEQIGRILATLAAEGLLDDTVVMFTSDHGEMLGDRGLQAKSQPYWPSVAVPAAIRHPDYCDRRRVTAPIELIDLTATILDIAGVDPVAALGRPWPSFHDCVPCRSLMPIISGATGQVRSFSFAECRNQWQMIQTDRYKYIRYGWASQGGPREELYDLASDPDELANCADDPAHAAALAACRMDREQLIDHTPPAQTSWAPLPPGACV